MEGLRIFKTIEFTSFGNTELRLYANKGMVTLLNIKPTELPRPPCTEEEQAGRTGGGGSKSRVARWAMP